MKRFLMVFFSFFVIPAAFAMPFYSGSPLQKVHDADDLQMVVNIIPQRELERKITFCDELDRNDFFTDERGFCTGFFVKKNQIITAGHCVRKVETFCKDFFFQDGLQRKYSCQKVIKKVIRVNPFLDYAIIQTQEDNQNFTPYKLQEIFTPNIYLIGYPLGGKIKLAKGSLTFGKEETTLSARVSSFQGNSGSPVFQKENGKLVGMLISGSKDFIFQEDRNCYELMKADSQQKETILSIEKILEGE